jgi:mannose-6-phosphate isomerase-like protein (cupin superfamily)
MRLHHADTQAAKGWFEGPWNSGLALAVGYANQGINEPHYHQRISEIYLVARGQSVLRIEQHELALRAGDVVVVEPGEVHTFLSSTPDYFHFVIHTPGLSAQEAAADKISVA